MKENMSDRDQLGNRMKEYEGVFRNSIPNRLPIILRLDGKSFHSYTKGCRRPVDNNLVEVMDRTAKYLCENIQGAQIAYVQSDEISILINNYQSFNTQPWFDNNLQKMVSVSAGMASAFFSLQSHHIFRGNSKLAVFDSRAFVLPTMEVVNYFIWRQQDMTRNSVQMLARTLYSHKKLIGKNNSELQELCFKKGINWNDCPVPQKRGRCLVKDKVIKEAINPLSGEMITAERSKWVVDNNIPIFSQDREYIEQYV
jgi:tRNA(His) guanylyltransferase